MVPTKDKGDDVMVNQSLILKQFNLLTQFDWHTNIIVLQKVFRKSVMIVKSVLDYYMAFDRTLTLNILPS